MKRILVLGGGPCGLSAARELMKYGFDVIVIEKESKVGGLCMTNTYKGFRFDLGGHRFISKNMELIADIRQMMGDELLTAQRKSVILLHGKTFDYPLSAQDILQKISPWENLKIFLSYFKSNLVRVFSRKDDISFEDWIINRFGRRLYNIFFGPYTGKLWGISPGSISSDWASQRISLLNLKDVIFHLFKFRAEEDIPRTYSRRFYYPREGIGQIFDIMANELSGNGGEIILGAKVMGVHVMQCMVEGVSFIQNGVVRRIECDAVISTIPLPELIRAFPPEITAGVFAHTLALRFRSLRFLNILVDFPDISENTWMYVSEDRYIMTRIQEPKRRSPFNAPDGKTSLMLEIPCNENDDIWNCPEDELMERCMKDLKETGIDISGRVLDYFTTLVTHAYPVYTLDYAMHRQKLFDFLYPYKNLITCGRQGAFRYIFMDEAMEMGIAAARKFAGVTSPGEADKCLIRSEKELFELSSMVKPT